MEEFEIAIFLDCDHVMLKPLVLKEWEPGITSHIQNLHEHVKRYNPEGLRIINKLSSKIDVDITKAQWIGDSFYIVRRDQKKEKKFIWWWGEIASYLEIHKFSGKDANCMGLAAVKANLSTHEGGNELNSCFSHHGVMMRKMIKRSSWDQLIRRIAYHLRYNKARIKALAKYDFYYR